MEEDAEEVEEDGVVAVLLLVTFAVAEAVEAFPGEAEASEEEDTAAVLLPTAAVHHRIAAVEEVVAMAGATEVATETLVPPMVHLRGGKLAHTDSTPRLGSPRSTFPTSSHSASWWCLQIRQAHVAG